MEGRRQNPYGMAGKTCLRNRPGGSPHAFRPFPPEGCMTSQQADNIVFASDLPLSSRLISLGEVIHFKKKQIIFEMGTVPEKLYYILSGSVRIVDL